MKLKRAIAVVVASTLLLLACSSAPPAKTVVESADAWDEADRAVVAARSSATAVAGYESAGTAAVPDAQVGPTLSTDWEVTEGHVTIVRYDETQ